MTPTIWNGPPTAIDWRGVTACVMCPSNRHILDNSWRIGPHLFPPVSSSHGRIDFPEMTSELSVMVLFHQCLLEALRHSQLQCMWIGWTHREQNSDSSASRTEGRADFSSSCNIPFHQSLGEWCWSWCCSYIVVWCLLQVRSIQSTDKFLQSRQGTIFLEIFPPFLGLRTSLTEIAKSTWLLFLALCWICRLCRLCSCIITAHHTSFEENR